MAALWNLCYDSCTVASRGLFYAYRIVTVIVSLVSTLDFGVLIYDNLAPLVSEKS